MNKSAIESNQANLCHWYIAMGADRDASQRGTTYRKLRAIERKLEPVILAACNGELEYDESTDSYPVLEAALGFAKVRVANIFGTLPEGFFINTDPRGYALKIDDAVLRQWDAKEFFPHRDFGGYGILAPELSRNV